MDLISRRIAMRKGKVTDQTFRLFKMEALTDGTILVEGSATTPFKSGKRRGKPKYIGPTTKTAITQSEIREEHDRYEKETGNCSRCLGGGKVQVGWSNDTAVFKPCARCQGSRKPPTPPGVVS